MKETYQYIKDFEYSLGWDKYALSYAKLPQQNTIYNLTKELAHSVVKHYIPKGLEKTVLDLNCGTGNDFPYFLDNNFKIIGTDGSAGMLNKAHEIYNTKIDDGQIKLFQVMMEDLDDLSFKENQFDLIYSITGGYSYINDDLVLKVNQQLSKYLKKGGYLITAHLTPFSMGETLYHLKNKDFKMSLLRLKKTLNVPIKGETHQMFLRSNKNLKNLRTAGLAFCSAHPILTTTPPYQTNYSPDINKFKEHSKTEFERLFKSKYNAIADQIMIVEQKIR